MRPGYSEEIKRQAIDMIRAGWPYQTTSDALQVSRDTVRQWFNKEPDIIEARALAIKMRVEGKHCKEIAPIINEQYSLKLKVQTVGAWTNKYVFSRREKRETYYEKKARVVWDLLHQWKRPYDLPKYYRFKPCSG